MTDVSDQTLGDTLSETMPCLLCMGYKKTLVFAVPGAPPTEMECNACHGTGEMPRPGK